MNVIEVENVSKMFRLGTNTGDLRDRFGSLFSRNKSQEKSQEEKEREFWALNDISFSVAEGESFGIIGHNGSGKSTLLKLITGIYKPTRGRLRTQGRISALIEVGAGFHQDLTGRENVYLNGSVLGMKKREIDRRFDEIVAFAELEKFIDTPVKRYSSGMYMRLGFAVAAHIDPDIVLVDEVLAVGDESFQAKCMNRMRELRREGRTIVFISHSMDAVAALCQRVMLLARGEMLTIGEPADVISSYRVSLAADRRRREHTAAGTEEAGPRSAELEILEIRLLDADGRTCDTFNIGDQLRLECTFYAHRRIEKPAFGVAIYRSDDFYASGVNTKFDGHRLAAVEGRGKFTLTYSSLPLLQGGYRFLVSAFREDNTHNALAYSQIPFDIVGKTLSHGLIDVPHHWEFGSALASSAERSLTEAEATGALIGATSGHTLAQTSLGAGGNA
ncbi:MAG: ABC transporter ATP-binding protein [Armatimonadetes bacterium]|nr:ABC transporter ATP-binding protein [Armatimonadota bacterium]